MENSPVNTHLSQESSAKKEVKKKPKVSKAEKLVGGFIVKPEASKEEAARPKVEEKAEDKPELTASEEQFAKQKIAQAASETLEDEPLAEVQEFYQRVGEGEADDEVLNDILADLEVEAELPADPEVNVSVEISTSETDGEELELGDETGEEVILWQAIQELDTEELEPETAVGRGGRRHDQDGNLPPAPPEPSESPGRGQEPSSRLPYRQAMPAIFGGAMYNPDIVPVSIAMHAESYPDYSNPKTAALVSGVIGYLIGKRRGRAKTEKQLLPIQKKLQKEVLGLQQQLQAKEMTIRKVTKQLRQPEKMPAVTIKKEQPKPPRTVAPEARAIHDRPVTQEHLGQVVVTVETAATVVHKQPEIVARQPESRPTPLEKHYLALNRNELLRVSETILVEGTSLRKIYNNHLVGERGLRRLVIEHFRGGDMKRALRREVVEHEIDFERDPVMRDHSSGNVTSPAVSTSTPTLQTLLQKAALSISSDKEEAKYYQARALYESQQQAKQRRQQRVLDISMGATIATLLALVLYLLLQRS